MDKKTLIKHVLFLFVGKQKVLLATRGEEYQKGFTLIEVLVALMIFSIMSALAYSGLNAIIKTQQHLEIQDARQASLQSAMRILSQDINGIVLREVRDELGDKQPPLRVGNLGEYRLEMTRTGWRNPAAQTRSQLQRVAYEYTGDTLYRLYWPHLDRAPDAKPIRQHLLDDVVEFNVTVLDPSLKTQDIWPLQQSFTNQKGQNQHQLPKALEVQIEINGSGKLKALYELVKTL